MPHVAGDGQTIRRFRLSSLESLPRYTVTAPAEQRSPGRNGQRAHPFLRVPAPGTTQHAKAERGCGEQGPLLRRSCCHQFAAPNGHRCALRSSDGACERGGGARECGPSVRSSKVSGGNRGCAQHHMPSDHAEDQAQRFPQLVLCNGFAGPSRTFRSHSSPI